VEARLEEPGSANGPTDHRRGHTHGSGRCSEGGATAHPVELGPGQVADATGPDVTARVRGDLPQLAQRKTGERPPGQDLGQWSLPQRAVVIRDQALELTAITGLAHALRHVQQQAAR
jgi:hypothetical protein